MLYRPTYCCDCGDRIERLEWRLWTSRRFCELCETEHKFDEVLKAVAGVGLSLSGIFGIGAYFSKPEKTVTISASRATSNQLNVGKGSKDYRGTVGNAQNGGAVQPGISENNQERESDRKVPLDTSKPEVRFDTTGREEKTLQKVTSEPVYFCGAATKKGSPCSRRVKGGGRCWQHEGKDAMLAEKELLISK